MPSHVSTIARALAKQRAKQNQEEGRTRVVEPPKWSFYAQWNHSFYALFRNRCIQIWRGAAALKKKSAFPDEMTCIEETEEKKSHSFH